MKQWCLSILLIAAIVLATTVGSTLSISTPSFRPLHLAFDPMNDRLYVAVTDANTSKSKILVFTRPERGGAVPDPSFGLSGTASGLSYDPKSETLFVADSESHALFIFDRIKPSLSTRPTRVLQKFNFPTGVYSDVSGGRLFVADAHPGSLSIYKDPKNIQGNARPERILSGEKTGLNGPFGVAADTERDRLYVSNFDGVLIFNLRDLSSPPKRVPLPEGTLARGLSFDPERKHLFIAAPMLRSYFLYDGERLEQVQLEGVSGIFPFSLAIDPKNDRLFLAGTKAEFGVIDRAGKPDVEHRPPGTFKRSIDRWIRWNESRPSPAPSPHHPPPLLDSNEVPGRIRHPTENGAFSPLKKPKKALKAIDFLNHSM